MTVQVTRLPEYPRQVLLLAPDSEGREVQMLLPDEEWLRLLIEIIDPDLVVGFCARLLQKRGYRVQRHKLGEFYDTWETV